MNLQNATIEEADHLVICREIMDSVAHGMFTVDKNMIITSYNRAAGEITGYSPEESIGKPCYEVFHTDVCMKGCPLSDAMRDGKAVLKREVALADKHGSMTFVSISSSVLHEAQGNIIGGVETIRSTTDFPIILDSISDGVITVDDKMLIVSFNRAAETITGFTHDEAIGKHCHEIFRTEHETSECCFKEAVETGIPLLNQEIEILDRNNRKKCISLSASVLLDSDGRAHGGVGTIRDLSGLYPNKIEMYDKFVFQNIASRNPSMRRLFNVTADIAASEATVFLHGESGTGKELFARAIHNLSSRRNGPLMTINCGALPENLCESEIFGVKKGAYTGAVESRPGRLELCNGGTFFLDEIGDMPLPLQVKLLRVLENKEFQPLGSNTPQKANVRFITATHRNLAEMVREGTFRQDLYFRINIVQLHLPPLRERKEDIPLLLEMALKKLNLAYGRKIQRISPDVLRLLLLHEFPGNVRELLNLIEQAVILCKGNEIGLEHMPNDFMPMECSEKPVRRRTSKAPDIEVLWDILSKHKWNRSDAANELGVDRTTLWRWVKSASLTESKSVPFS